MRGLAALVIAVIACSLPQTGHSHGGVTFSEMSNRVRLIADHVDYEWLSVNTPHCRIYYQEDTYAAENLDDVKAECEKAITRSLAFLGEGSYSTGVRVFVVESRDELVPMVGGRYKGFALMGHDTVVAAYNPDVRLYAVHEIFHIISGRTWGDPIPWLREGSAVYVDGTCLDYEKPFHAAAAYLKSQSELFPARSLVTNFNAAAAQSDLRAYLQAGSLIQYLYETYGREAVARYWRSGAFETTDAFGKNVEALETEWLDYLDDVDSDTIDWSDFEARGCG